MNCVRTIYLPDVVMDRKQFGACVCWARRFMSFALAWPPGIHAQLFIRGFKALLLRIGEIEALELLAVRTGLLAFLFGWTEPFLLGMR